MKYVFENGKHVIVTHGNEGNQDYFIYRLVYMKHQWCIRDDIEEWLEENVGHFGIHWDFEFIPAFTGIGRFYFNQKEDALKFKLTWCESS